MATYRILTFDGGGIKGLFTATLLERILQRRPTLLERTDLLSGTSTGGIIALGLAAGKAPPTMARLYREDGPRIFDDSWWDDLLDLGKAVGADYSNKGLKRVLKREFGSTILSDLGMRVLIPAFDLDAPAKRGRPRAWKPKFFHNFPGRDSDGRERVVDVALRTSAAPTYFPSHQGYIDGGVVANNPSVAALTQALQTGGCSLDEVYVLSLGTGAEPKYLAGKRHDWGWGQWARPLVSLMISGSMGVADYQCNQLLGDRYRRVNPNFNRGVDLDDTSQSTLRYLENRAKGVRLTTLLRWLDQVGW